MLERRLGFQSLLCGSWVIDFQYHGCGIYGCYLALGFETIRLFVFGKNFVEQIAERSWYIWRLQSGYGTKIRYYCSKYLSGKLSRRICFQGFIFGDADLPRINQGIKGSGNKEGFAYIKN